MSFASGADILKVQFRIERHLPVDLPAYLSGSERVFTVLLPDIPKYHVGTVQVGMKVRACRIQPEIIPNVLRLTRS